jgi:hypothetical protein
MSCDADLECGDLLIGNSMDVRLLNVKVRGTVVANATVTVTVKNSAGGTVSGANELTVPADETAGNYLGVLPETLDLTENGRYQVIVTATKSGLGVGQWKCWRIAKYREAC